MHRHRGIQTRSNISRIPTPIRREGTYSSLNRSKENAYLQSELWDVERGQEHIPQYLTAGNYKDSNFAGDLPFFSGGALTAVSHSNPSCNKGGVAFFVDTSNSKSNQNIDNTQKQTMCSELHSTRCTSVIQNADVSTQEIKYFPNKEYNRSSAFASGACFLRKMVENERSKRINSELFIQQLQDRLLECEEKLLIACRNLREKDALLDQLQNDRSNMVSRWRHLEEAIDNLREQKKVLLSELKEIAQENNHSESGLQNTNYTDVCNKTKNYSGDGQGKSTTQEYLETEDMNSKATQKSDEDLNRFPENQNEMISDEHKGRTLKEKRGKPEREKNTLKEEAEKELQEETRRKEKSFCDKRERLLEQTEEKECTRHNLHKYQIEIITRNKLKQNRTCNKASLEKEAKKRKQEIIEISASHIKHLAQKHDAELKLLEEKHKEELWLRDLKLCESLHATSVLENKLQKHKEDNTALLKKLKKCVEKQFNCAINIMKESMDTPFTSVASYEGFRQYPVGVRRSNSDSQIYKATQRQ